MKRFFALLCIFLLLCGCSGHTGEISEISESSEASSAAGEPEPEAGSTAEEKPDVYLDPDGRLRFGNIELEYQDSIWILAYIDDAIYYRWQDRDDRQKVTIYKADLKSQKITEIGTIERYRMSTSPIDVKLIDNHLFLPLRWTKMGKISKATCFPSTGPRISCINMKANPCHILWFITGHMAASFTACANEPSTVPAPPASTYSTLWKIQKKC